MPWNAITHRRRNRIDLALELARLPLGPFRAVEITAGVPAARLTLESAPFWIPPGTGTPQMAKKTDPAEKLNGRERLIQAAAKLFGRDGFEGTSLRTIADEANVSWGLVRFYFGSKEGLREAVEEWVMRGYLDLALAAAQIASNDELADVIEQRTRDLPDMARYLRRAIVEGRPMGLDFIRRLMEADSVYVRLSSEFPAETWLVDPMRTVAARLGYLLLAPQFEALLNRNPFSQEELKRRNLQTNRMLELVRLGLQTEEKRRETKRGVS